MLQKKLHYIITKVGPEGFSEFLYLSQSKDWSVNFVKGELKKEKENKELLNNLIQKSSSENIYDFEENHLEKEIALGNITEDIFWETAYKTDTFCLQEWDGEKFTCVCSREGLENPNFLY